MYAIRLADVTGEKYGIAISLLLAPVMTQEHEYVDDKEIDGCCVVPMHCSDERAEAIIEIMRMKYRTQSIRWYRKTTGAWKKVDYRKAFDA